MLQKAPVHVLGRRVHADVLISQRVWSQMQKEEPSVSAA